LNKVEQLSEINPEILLCDGFEDALIGFVDVFNKTIALYDKQKCLDILIQRDGMTEEEAFEFFDYNVTGSYDGEHTPAFATFFD
jgi:hypothetical protein